MPEKDPSLKRQENIQPRIYELKRRAGKITAEHGDFIWKWGLTATVVVVTAITLYEYCKHRKKSPKD